MLKSGETCKNNDHTCLFHCINTCRVPWTMFEHEAVRLPQDLANVNAWKNMCDPYIITGITIFIFFSFGEAYQWPYPMLTMVFNIAAFHCYPFQVQMTFRTKTANNIVDRHINWDDIRCLFPFRNWTICLWTIQPSFIWDCSLGHSPCSNARHISFWPVNSFSLQYP